MSTIPARAVAPPINVTNVGARTGEAVVPLATCPWVLAPQHRTLVPSIAQVVPEAPKATTFSGFVKPTIFVGYARAVVSPVPRFPATFPPQHQTSFDDEPCTTAQAYIGCVLWLP